MRLRSRYVLLAGALIFGATGLVRAYIVRNALGPPLEQFCPGGGAADPNVIFCEDFEDSASVRRWDVTSRGNMWAPSDFVQCDPAFGFGGGCAAWSNRLVFDTSWGYWGYSAKAEFPARDEFYVRWYQYVSSPYAWGRLEDKSLLVRDQSETIIGYVGTSRNHLPVEANSGPGMPFVANYQDFDWDETGKQYSKVNRFQNQGSNITLEPGKWYLFEWYVKVNSPGMADGITRLWVDDASRPVQTQTLRMQYNDMRWLKASDGGKRFGEMQLTVYDQRCDMAPNVCPPNGPEILDQSQRWDNIVVSQRPIGAMSAAAPPPSSRPVR
jgi:hypothetical protein